MTSFYVPDAIAAQLPEEHLEPKGTTMTRDELAVFRAVELANDSTSPFDGRDEDAEIIASLLHSGYLIENEQEQLFVTPRGVDAAAQHGRD